jgi:hypothetical protein
MVIVPVDVCSSNGALRAGSTGPLTATIGDIKTVKLSFAYADKEEHFLLYVHHNYLYKVRS